MTQHRERTALREFAYNELNLESKHYHVDRKKNYANQYVVLVNKHDYIRTVENLFTDKIKFQVSLNYVNTFFTSGEKSIKEKKRMGPKNTQTDRAHSLLNLTKSMKCYPFRPILCTTTIPYFDITNLLSPLHLMNSWQRTRLTLPRLREGEGLVGPRPQTF